MASVARATAPPSIFYVLSPSVDLRRGNGIHIQGERPQPRADVAADRVVVAMEIERRRTAEHLLEGVARVVPEERDRVGDLPRDLRRDRALPRLAEGEDRDRL